MDLPIAEIEDRLRRIEAEKDVRILYGPASLEPFPLAPRKAKDAWLNDV